MEQQAVLDPQEEMLLLEILRNKRRIQALADTRARLVQIHDDALAAHETKQLHDKNMQLTVVTSPPQ